MTLFRRKQLNVNIFLRPKTRQALTAFVLIGVFCFGHELGRALLLQHSPFSQATVGQCFHNRSELQILPLHP